MSRYRSRQDGFSIITAIFLLVVLGGLGAYMISISGVQRTTTAFAVQGARAHQAARSGIEWAIYRAFDPATTAATCGAAPITNNFTYNGSGLNGFRVRVTCDYTRHQESSECSYAFAIEAEAEYASFGTPDYVKRTLRATVTDHASPIAPACP